MKMTSKLALTWGAMIALVSVALGAFGAHALKPALVAANQLENFEIGVRYQFYHALALLFVGLWMSHQKLHKSFIPLCFVAGIVFFSGGLYAVSLGGESARSVAMIIPVGGVFFLAGWLLLIIRLVKSPGHG